MGPVDFVTAQQHALARQRHSQHHRSQELEAVAHAAQHFLQESSFIQELGTTNLDQAMEIEEAEGGEELFQSGVQAAVQAAMSSQNATGGGSPDMNSKMGTAQGGT